MCHTLLNVSFKKSFDDGSVWVPNKECQELLDDKKIAAINSYLEENTWEQWVGELKESLCKRNTKRTIATSRPLNATLYYP